MSQTDSSRFKSAIIDVEWAAAPAPTRSNGHHPPTGLALRAEPASSAVIARSWPSPIHVHEEVELPPAPDPRLVVLSQPNSVQAGAYRLLHHRLLARGDPRVIAVTSAWPREGKTTCAANLALALSGESLARVLLIEANVQRPGLAALFGFVPTESFIGRLVQHLDAAPPYAVAAILGTRLQVAALRSDVAQNLRLDRLLLGTAIRELRRAYDYIIIDAASALESPDANVAAECADGVIVTARAAKSRKGSLRRAIAHLSPATVLGAVLLET
jgi:Mrp family chromosome partitioning ATPase